MRIAEVRRQLLNDWLIAPDIPATEYDSHTLWTSPEGFKVVIKYPSRKALPNNFYLMSPNKKLVASFTIDEWFLDNKTFWIMDRVHTEPSFRGKYYMLNLVTIVFKYLKGKVSKVYVNGKNDHLNLYKKVGFVPVKMNDQLDRLVRHHILHMLYPNPKTARQDYTFMVKNLGGKQ